MRRFTPRNALKARAALSGVTLEVITDQGLLSNPYRYIRYLDQTARIGYTAVQQQIYPNTHTSTAVEGRVKYFLPYRAAVSASYRYFDDTWGIRAHTAELGYTQPVSNLWILEGRLRYVNNFVGAGLDLIELPLWYDVDERLDALAARPAGVCAAAA